MKLDARQYRVAYHLLRRAAFLLNRDGLRTAQTGLTMRIWFPGCQRPVAASYEPADGDGIRLRVDDPEGNLDRIATVQNAITAPKRARKTNG